MYGGDQGEAGMIILAVQPYLKLGNHYFLLSFVMSSTCPVHSHLFLVLSLCYISTSYVFVALSLIPLPSFSLALKCSSRQKPDLKTTPRLILVQLSTPWNRSGGWLKRSQHQVELNLPLLVMHLTTLLAGDDKEPNGGWYGYE